MGIENLVKKFNKDEGKSVITKGNEIQELTRIPTGSLSLDVETGGGLPVGKVISLTGEESTGKSVLALKAAGEYQRKWPEQDVLWIDAEGAWDPVWAKALGVDRPEDIYVMRPEYMEQAYNMALLAVDENAGLIIIDSLAALSPKDEAEEDIEKMFIGVAARLNRKLFRKFQNAVNDANFKVPSTLIYINHLNEKVGAQTKPGMPPPLVEPGGRALRFFPSIKIEIRSGETFPKPKSNDESVEPKAKAIKFYVAKNKTAPPYRRGHFWFFFDTLDNFRQKGTYDNLEEIIRYAIKYNIIKQRASAYDLIHPETGELETFKGSNAVAQHIRDKKEVQDWVVQAVTERAAKALVTEPPTPEKKEDELAQQEPEEERKETVPETVSVLEPDLEQ